MERLLRLSIALLCLWHYGLLAAEYPGPKDSGVAGTEMRIENRAQLLSAINAWMKAHHESEWTMDELIGRAFDQAYIIYFIYHDSPLDSSVEPFLVSLIKNQPFTQKIKLRSEWRDEITLHTAAGEITRQRLEWNKVRKNQLSWSEVDSKSSDTPRRLPIPPHFALSLDVLASTTGNSTEKLSGKSPPSSILLASTSTKGGQLSQPSRIKGGNSSEPTATPQELLESVNRWKGLFHQPQVTLDDLTARVADEIFNLREAGKLSREIDIELFLECLAENTPFIHPIGVDAGGPDSSGEPNSFTMLSINEKLTLPSRHIMSVNIPDLPWDLNAEAPPPKLDWKRINFSYVFRPVQRRPR